MGARLGTAESTFIHRETGERLTIGEGVRRGELLLYHSPAWKTADGRSVYLANYPPNAEERADDTTTGYHITRRAFVAMGGKPSPIRKPESSRDRFRRAVRQALQGMHRPYFQAEYDEAGNCTTCGEAGRCPGYHGKDGNLEQDKLAQDEAGRILQAEGARI